MAVRDRLQRGLAGGVQGLQQALISAMLGRQIAQGLTEGEQDFVEHGRKQPLQPDPDIPQPPLSVEDVESQPFGLGGLAANQLPRRRRFERFNR